MIKKIKEIIQVRKNINLNKISTCLGDVYNRKKWLIKDKEFLFLSLMLFLSFFSIPNVDHLFFTIIRVVFFIMSTLYILFSLKVFSSNGIKFDDFKPIVRGDYDWVDFFGWVSLSLYLFILFMVINLSLYSIIWIFVFLNKITANKYN